MGQSENKRNHNKIGGLFRTAPFLAAGIFSIILYYVEVQDTSLNILLLLLTIHALLTWSIYYTIVRQIPYSTKDVISDLLLATFLHLGNGFRINIMELKSPDTNPYTAYFHITFCHGYTDPTIFLNKIHLHTPGVSDAFKNSKSYNLEKNKLDVTIDTDLNHLWCSPIQDRNGNSVAVLNIDYISKATLSDTQKSQILNANENLSNLLSIYWTTYS